VGASAPTKGGNMIFSKDDMDVLHSLYYNFANFEVRLSRDPKDVKQHGHHIAEQWQINAPDKNRTWRTGCGTSVTEAYNSLMKRMAESGHFDAPEWLGAGS